MMATALSLGFAATGRAQFTCGSNGSWGPIDVTSGTTTLTTPADGVFHATTINVASGATLKFTRNAANTPIYLLATGAVTISGTINVDGAHAGALAGAGGPGGFDGGNSGTGGVPPGAGQGPGAGKGSTGQPGDGAYGSLPAGHNPAVDGSIYGSPLQVPLVGGSGGGGNDLGGGGGGGGAVLLCSSSNINLSGQILARGGNSSRGCNSSSQNFSGHGSGGAMRLLSPVVAGAGALNVTGCTSGGTATGYGRIRIDAIDGSQIAFSYSGPVSRGSFMQVAASPTPRLDIVEVAGNAIPLGSGPVDFTLPPGAPSSQDVVVQGTDFTGVVPIRVVLTPTTGDMVVYDADLDMGLGNPAQVTVTVDVPENNPVRIHAWTVVP